MKNNAMDKQNGNLSKLAHLRQNKGIKPKEVDIEKAIDGFVSSIDTKTMLEEISRNSSLVNLIMDRSSSMYGTADDISEEINEFTIRQSGKIYKTAISLTLFNDEVYPELKNVDVREFQPIEPWKCYGGTNIYDAIFSAITSTKTLKVFHKLHLITTDGENGESRHSLEEVRNLIIRSKTAGEHIFLLYNSSSDCDTVSAKEYAMKLGIEPDNAVNFNRNGDGIKIIFQTIEEVLDGLRTTGVVPKDWAKAITAHAANPSLKADEVKYLGK